MSILKKMKSNKMVIVCLAFILFVCLVGVLAPVLAPNDPLEADTSLKYATSSAQYPLGNDLLGRCVLSRLIYGIRPSILYVLLALLLTVILGTIFGLISGYVGGAVDNLIMRFCDLMMSFPTEVMTIAVVGVFGIGVDKILLTYVLLKWAWYCRMIRNVVVQYADLNYVRFAKASGCSTAYIVRRHVLPSVLAEIIVISSSSVSSMVLLISSLSFLGLGIQAPTPEWGMMLNEARNVMYVHPEQMLYPGLAVMLISVAFAFLGDGLRDVLDPQHNGSLGGNNG